MADDSAPSPLPAQEHRDTLWRTLLRLIPTRRRAKAVLVANELAREHRSERLNANTHGFAEGLLSGYAAGWNDAQTNALAQLATTDATIETHHSTPENVRDSLYLRGRLKDARPSGDPVPGVPDPPSRSDPTIVGLWESLERLIPANRRSEGYALRTALHTAMSAHHQQIGRHLGRVEGDLAASERIHSLHATLAAERKAFYEQGRSDGETAATFDGVAVHIPPDIQH